jgi:hypothetical protein
MMMMPWELSQVSELARAKHERRKLRDLRRRLLGRGRLSAYLGTPCPYCSILMSDCDGPEGWRAPTRDHRVPRSRGGYNIVENITVCCRSQSQLSNWRGVMPAVNSFRQRPNVYFPKSRTSAGSATFRCDRIRRQFFLGS